MDGDGPRFGAMIALVAVVVATVILVFFGSGTRSAACSSDEHLTVPLICEQAVPASGSVFTGGYTRPFNGAARHLRHRERRAEPRGQPAPSLPRRDLARAGLLDLRGRTAADRRPDAGGLRHRGVAVPVHRHDHLPDRPPAGVPGRRARRDLEIAAAQARLQNLEHPHCQYCGFEVEKSFLRCPSCLRRLKEPCTVCGKPLDPRWKICPYCEAEVGQAPPEARRARPRRAAPAAAAGGAVPRAARPAQAARQPRPAEEAPRSDPLGRAATGLHRPADPRLLRSLASRLH